MSDRIAIVLQARTGSTRLPGKMTRAFYEGRTILQLILEELAALFDPAEIVVATSTAENDEAIVAAARPFDCFRGSENDVLHRVTSAVADRNVDWVVRVCADNPFLRAHFIRELLDACEPDTDYASFCLSDGKPVILSHWGLFAEVISKKTLERIEQIATSPRHREHLTSHILDNPEMYSRKLLPLPEYVNEAVDVRLTVDTSSDFDVCQSLYADVVDEHGARFSAEQLMSVLATRPQLHQLMAAEIAANEKK